MGGLVDTHPNTWLPLDAHGARTTIDSVHHEIHEGDHYTAFLYDGEVDSTSTLSVLITVPAAGEMHLVGLVKSSLGGSFTWSEAPNASGGSAITPYNNNRQSTNAATLVVTSNPTFVSAGTVLLQTDVGATGNPTQAAGGNFAARQEWILAQSTLYLLRFVSATNDAKVTLILEWYEES